MSKRVGVLHTIAGFVCLWGCDFPRPADVGPSSVGDASNQGDASSADAGVDVAVDSQIDANAPPSICTPDQPLRCDGGNLIRCNSAGTAEVSETCVLGCSTALLRCNDVNPSNSLAQYLDMTMTQPDFNLGTTATVNTDDGTVMVDGQPVSMMSATLSQAPAPTIRVFIIHGLIAGAVTVTGKNAIAVVSHADIRIENSFTASANGAVAGAGAFNDGSCTGHEGVITTARGGCGGGGFGGQGAPGGSATNDDGTANGGDGGAATGNLMLVPLRGGCDSGRFGGSITGTGGGAIQLVSRTKITIGGALAANGSSLSGGGSGGGILLEAPVIEVTGAIVANGGAGAGGCVIPNQGEDGRLDATPATGGDPCNTTFSKGAKGGNGGARNAGAGIGVSLSVAGTSISTAYAGNGGGGVGRIRVNTVAGGLQVTGVFSPNPSTGPISTR